jgi:ribonuclease E
MSAYPNLFEVLDDNGDVIAKEIDRKSKIIVKEAPTTATKKKETPKKEEKKPESTEQATDGFEIKGQNRPRQPKAEKTSPEQPSSGRGGRGRGGRLDRPPRAEGENAARRQDGESRPPRGDRPPRAEGEGNDERPRRPRQDRPPRQEGDQPRQPREYRPPRDNVEGEENPRPYRERRNFDGPRDNEESGERRYNNEDRPRGGRGGRGGRGRGFYNNRARSENGHDLTEGAPIESEPNQRPPRRPREDRLTDEKGFVQAKQRAYDRRSATGRSGDDVKRSGRGPNNWGAAGEESLDAYAENVNYERAVDNAEAAPVEGEVPRAEEEAPAQVEANQVKKEEDNTRTLKEYREAQANELASIELPKPRQVEDDKNLKVLKKDLNLTLSVIAPTKEKKKAETSDAAKPKTRGNKQSANELLNFKTEARQDNRRRDNREQRSDQPRKQATAPAAATQSPAKIDKNSKDFPALVAAKN